MHAYPPDDPDGRVAALFAREIPEVASGKVVIRALARTAGVRTNVAVDTDDPELDSIAVCVGAYAARVRSISAALGGEAIHITTWSSFPDRMIALALSPLLVRRVELNERFRQAVVWLREIQHDRFAHLASSSEHIELASRLSGWNIEIVVDPHVA